jgi:hypothetical protein
LHSGNNYKREGCDAKTPVPIYVHDVFPPLSVA